MIADMQIPVLIGPGGNFAQGSNGIQVKTLATGNTSVSFTGVPYNNKFGYMLFVDTSTADTANTAPPKRTVEKPTITPTGNGTCTVTYTISTVTAAQNNSTCQLWVFK